MFLNPLKTWSIISLQQNIQNKLSNDQIKPAMAENIVNSITLTHLLSWLMCKKSASLYIQQTQSNISNTHSTFSFVFGLQL